MLTFDGLKIRSSGENVGRVKKKMSMWIQQVLPTYLLKKNKLFSSNTVGIYILMYIIIN